MRMTDKGSSNEEFVSCKILNTACNNQNTGSTKPDYTISTVLDFKKIMHLTFNNKNAPGQIQKENIFFGMLPEHNQKNTTDEEYFFTITKSLGLT
jgi:hypothetical protein